MKLSRPLLAAFGHHKCASMWLQGICAQVAQEVGARFKAVYYPEMFGGDIRHFVERQKVDFLGYGNADYRHVQQLLSKPLKAFHYVRDPRDIVVSAYFSHRNSHSTDHWHDLIAYREKLQSCSKDEGLFLELDFRRTQFEEMRSWPDVASSDRIQTYRVEDITVNPFAFFLDMFRFLELLDEAYYTPSKRIFVLASRFARKVEHITGRRFRVPLAPKVLPAERVLGIVWERNFARLSGGRQRGAEDVRSHYRRGVHGDWLNHFTVEHLNYFKKQYGDLVVQYGYESDADWEQKYIAQIEERRVSAADHR